MPATSPLASPERSNAPPFDDGSVDPLFALFTNELSRVLARPLLSPPYVGVAFGWNAWLSMLLNRFEFGSLAEESGWNDCVKLLRIFEVRSDELLKSGDCCGWKACVMLLNIFDASDEKPPPLSPLEVLALGSNVWEIMLYICDAGSMEPLLLLGSPNDEEKSGDCGGGVCD